MDVALTVPALLTRSPYDTDETTTAHGTTPPDRHRVRSSVQGEESSMMKRGNQERCCDACAVAPDGSRTMTYAGRVGDASTG